MLLKSCTSKQTGPDSYIFGGSEVPEGQYKDIFRFGIFPLLPAGHSDGIGMMLVPVVTDSARSSRSWVCGWGALVDAAESVDLLFSGVEVVVAGGVVLAVTEVVEATVAGAGVETVGGVL